MHNPMTHQSSYISIRTFNMKVTSKQHEKRSAIGLFKVRTAHDNAFDNAAQDQVYIIRVVMTVKIY